MIYSTPFTPLFQILLIKHISLRKLTRKQFKQKRKPWITSGIKTAVRQKINYLKILLGQDHMKF